MNLKDTPRVEDVPQTTNSLIGVKDRGVEGQLAPSHLVVTLSVLVSSCFETLGCFPLISLQPGATPQILLLLKYIFLLFVLYCFPAW